MARSPRRNAPDLPAGRSGERLPPQVRRGRILASIEKTGFVSISGLAGELGVSGMTIRRDIGMLEGHGAVERTHGGAIADGRFGHVPFDEEEPTFESRMRRNASEKSGMARLAAGLVGRGESIGLDVGTSTLALAGALAGRNDLRVFTSSLRVATQMTSSGSEVYVLGGRVREIEWSVVGSRAVEELATRFLDRVFLGVSGVDASGLYDYSLEDSDVKRAFINNAGAVVVLCDASKFGRRALSRIAPLSEVSVLVTDAPPPPELAAALERNGVEVMIAGATHNGINVTP